MDENVKSEMTEAVEKAVGTEGKFTYLYMKQVPKETAEEFKKLADQEFSGHFGFALKALLDQLVITRELVSESRMDEFNERLNALETMLANNMAKQSHEQIVEAVKGRRTVGGLRQ